MPNAAGSGHHRVEGVDERDDDDKDVRHPDDQAQPDEGPTLSGVGAMPSGNAMDHWGTAMPNTDATKGESMPKTRSTPLPGETEDRMPV
jgi:hypothetical protein